MSALHETVPEALQRFVASQISIMLRQRGCRILETRQNALRSTPDRVRHIVVKRRPGITRRIIQVEASIARFYSGFPQTAEEVVVESGPPILWQIGMILIAFSVPCGWRYGGRRVRIVLRIDSIELLGDIVFECRNDDLDARPLVTKEL